MVQPLPELALKSLALSADRRYWGEAAEVLLLGPWCLPPGGQLQPGQTMLPSPWDDRARLDADIAVCYRAHLELIRALAGRLDELHGTALGERYWRTLLGPWALFYTHQTYMALVRLREALAHEPGLECRLLPDADFYVPVDTPDYVRYFQTDRFNLQLCSHVLRRLGASRPELSSPPEAAPEAAPAPRGLKARARAAADAVAAFLVKHGPCEVLTDELYPMSRRVWRLAASRGFRLCPLTGSLPPEALRPAVLDERRLGLAELKLEGELGAVLASSLPRALPAIFLEGFPLARAAALERLGRTPKLVLAGSHLHYDELFKLTIAEAALRGARVVGFQHGGAYGTTKAPLVEAHERGITDAFLSWGWSATEPGGALRDVPVPHLSSLPPARWRENDELLLATTEGLRCPHHLFHSPGEQQWEDFFDQRDRFIGRLPASLRAKLSVRVHPRDFGWRVKERLRASFPDLRLDPHSVPFLDRLLQARLIVTDHPTTSFLEAMALDVPSVHFWRWDRWELRASALPAFEELKAVGIVHTDPESAAAQAAKVYDEPGSWWEAEPTRRARARFKELFARTDPRWIGAWNRAIDAELALAGAGSRPDFVH